MRAASILVLFTPLCFAQPVIRVGTRLVEVHVVVRDKDGPVSGLKQSDFSVSDEGKPQKIAVFSSASTTDSQKGSDPLSAGTFSNRIDRAGRVASSVTVILLDRLNTALSDQTYSNDELRRFLKTTPPGDPIAIYTLGNGLHTVQDFTGDPTQLLSSFERLMRERAVDLAADNGPDSTLTLPDSFMRSDLPIRQTSQNALTAAMQKEAALNRVRITANAMQAIAKHLAGVPGRKNLVWISSSFPLDFELRDREDTPPELTAAVRALNDANVALYPVDARGLGTNAGYGGGAVHNHSNPMAPTASSRTQTMVQLARATGGRALYGWNDLSKGVRDALDDAKTQYILGFYPSDSAEDGKLHEIRVTVDRKGAEVLHRKGYFSGNPPALSEEARHKALIKVFTAPLEATGVGLAAALVPIPPTAGAPPQSTPGKYSLRVLIYVRDLQPQQAGDDWLVNADVGLYLASAKPPRVQLQPLTVKFTTAALNNAMQRGHIFQVPIETDGAPSALRVAVQDTVTGAVGSVTVPVR